MSYRPNCAKYGETYVGNPGPVPYCSMTGELEPRCDKCVRPNFTNFDHIQEMNEEELASWVIDITEDKTTDWLAWLKEEYHE